MSAEWNVITSPTLENDQRRSEESEASRHFAQGILPAENSPRNLVTELLACQRSPALPMFNFCSISYSPSACSIESSLERRFAAAPENPAWREGYLLSPFSSQRQIKMPLPGYDALRPTFRLFSTR